MRYLVLLLLVGCATQLTFEEREYRYAETYEQWWVCKEMYLRGGGVWITHWHHSKAIEKGLKRPIEYNMVDDILRNNCSSILRQAGYL